LNKHSNSLKNDLKAIAKVAGALQRTFPDEFLVSAESLSFSNSFGNIFAALFGGLHNQVQIELDELGRLVDTMNAGAKKTGAQIQYQISQSDLAAEDSDYRLLSKYLLAALRATHAGEQIAFSGLSDSVTTEINGSGWVANLVGARYYGNTGSIS